MCSNVRLEMDFFANATEEFKQAIEERMQFDIDEMPEWLSSLERK